MAGVPIQSNVVKSKSLVMMNPEFPKMMKSTPNGLFRMIQNRRLECHRERTTRANGDDLICAIRRIKHIRRLAERVDAGRFAQRDGGIGELRCIAGARIVADNGIGKADDTGTGSDNEAGQCQHEQLNFFHGLIFQFCPRKFFTRTVFTIERPVQSLKIKNLQASQTRNGGEFNEPAKNSLDGLASSFSLRRNAPIRSELTSAIKPVS